VSNGKIIVTIDPDLEELIPGFLENRAKDLTNLRAALGRNDLPAVQSIGHSLKGVGGGYGFVRLSEIGAEMERAARSGDSSTLPGLLDELADYLNRVVVSYE
jgi:HPt (histidine-containing phosphotransfer) domain-containing protein